MNSSILKLIKEAVNSSYEKNIDILYCKIWFSILEQFKLNHKKNEIMLLLNEKANENYNLLYYAGESIVEIQFKMTELEKTTLFKMLLDDGFIIKDSVISIDREKIIDYATENKKNVTVPEHLINMIDKHKIKKYNKC